MTTNATEFAIDVTQAAKRLTESELVKFHKFISIEFLKRVVERTPVDTGRARGAWQLTINVSPEEEAQLGTPGALDALQSLQPFDIVYITNNVEYIGFLEEGSSQQAPEGMVAITVAELEPIVRSQAA